MTNEGEKNVEGVDLDGMRAVLDGRDVVFALLFGSRARGEADASSDVDVALAFPADLGDHDRFRRRNRIDADLQAHADGFVDVSDVDRLPTPVARAALRDGVVLVGDESAVEAYRERIEAEHEATADERRREHREFLDRLARGDV